MALTLHRDEFTDAQGDAEDAFARLRTRLVAAGVPPTCQALGFQRWARLAHQTAPMELAAFIDACRVVQAAALAG